MSENVRWIEHKGKKILYCDYSDLTEVEVIAVIEDHEKVLLECGKSSVLILNRAPDVKITSRIKNRGDESDHLLKSRGIENVTAVVGLPTLQRIIASVIKRDIFFAKSEAEAMEWLVNQ